MLKIVSFIAVGIIVVGLMAKNTFLICEAKVDINEGTHITAGNAGYEVKGIKDTTLSESVGKVIEAVLALVGTIFFALTVYAGILWMTAQGKDERVEKATKIFQTSVIGLIIVVGAYSITHYVLRAIFNVSGLK